MIPRGPKQLLIAHTDVHHALSRYFEWAQDAIAAALAIIVLVLMGQGIWTLALVAIAQGREPRVVLPQIVLLLILVELFRTLIFYLREHRVAVGLMIEVALISVLRELLINPPGASSSGDLTVALVLLVLGALMVADRLTRARRFQPAPEREAAQLT